MLYNGLLEIPEHDSGKDVKVTDGFYSLDVAKDRQGLVHKIVRRLIPKMLQDS